MQKVFVIEKRSDVECQHIIACFLDEETANKVYKDLEDSKVDKDRDLFTFYYLKTFPVYESASEFSNRYDVNK